MDPKHHLGILLRELERRGATVAARRCIEAAIARDDASTRRAAIAAIEPLAGPALSLHSLGSSALLELGEDAAPALRRWILAHRDNAHGLVWATLNSGVDAAPGLAAFVELLDEKDERLVAAAAAGIGHAGAAGLPHAARLRGLARSLGDSWLRGQAMAALGRVGAADRETLDLLIRTAREGDDEERLQATIALGLIGPAAGEAVETICRHLRDTEIFNACEAANALRRIGVRSRLVGDALARAVEGEEDSDRYMDFLRAIGELGAPSPSAAKALEMARESEDELKAAGAMLAQYLASGDAVDVRAALSRWETSSDILSLLGEWRVPLDAFADDILRLAKERSETGPEGAPTVGDQLRGAVQPGPGWDEPWDAAPYLMGLVARLGPRAREAIPALARIAADEREAPWTRGLAQDAVRDLGGP